MPKILYNEALQNGVRLGPAVLNKKKNETALLVPKRAGICLHVTSLPGQYGIGEIGAAARRFIRQLKDMRVSVWQVLPAGPTGFGNSPYQALSLFAGNEMLIDVETLIKEGYLGKRDVEPLLGLSRGAVDYERLVPAKAAVLQNAADRFGGRARAQDRAAFDDFLHRSDQRWLHDYACYRVLKHRYGERAWPHWERGHRRRYIRALAKLERDARVEIDRVKILQFHFHRQWRALRDFAAESGVLLFGDMPIYMAADSADAWTRPDLLQVDRDGVATAVAGVPPDYFDPDGQLWGNPLYRWPRHKKEHFAWWVERVRHAARQTDLVRIDHFRGFESYWSVPADAPTAKDGRWRKAPGDALFGALREKLGQLPIIAEDLGDITPAVTRLRRRFGIPGMQVLQFALADERFDPADIEADCVCYTGTHDNDTSCGWLGGGAHDPRTPAQVRAMRKRVLAHAERFTDAAHLGLLHIALQSAAGLAIAPMQDILGLGSEARLNTPGTESGNWRWRLKRGEIDQDLCARIGAMIDASGRSDASLPHRGA